MASKNSTSDVFTTLAKRYPTPQKVQRFLKGFRYNKEEKGETVMSAEAALRRKTMHCLEAALLSAAILEKRGYPPLLLSLDSSDHLCHAVFVFKTKTGWGSVAKSRERGLHGRAPIFRSIRDLAWSYYDPFVDKTGKLTGYALLNLNDSDSDWRHSKKNLWKLEKFVVNSKHQKIKSTKKRYEKLFEQFLRTGTTPLSGKHWW